MLANIFRRDTIEAVYPRPVFEGDAGVNSKAGVAVLHGVFITSAPDERGDFRMTRATRRVGEVAHDHSALFLCPYMGKSYCAFSLQGGSKGAVAENGDIMAPHPEEYAAFIDELIRAARGFGAPDAREPDGDRFRGLRGGG
jgi:hypothetical protein